MKLKKLIISAVLLAIGVVAVAQNTRSAYFTDGYLYRYQQNPAFENERNFIAIPALGNVNAGVNGNLRLDDILYNIDGQTTTFLNPQVDAKEFLDAVGDKSRFGSDLKIGLLAVGFKAFKGYNTISINARANAQTHIPTTFFSLLKEGIE
ncbi:MAG: hypothetical protein IKL35_08230, partial [Muribaculaceae bacterium]|nr:hypothetical protein [Muribaculaceae bacterium]